MTEKTSDCCPIDSFAAHPPTLTSSTEDQKKRQAKRKHTCVHVCRDRLSMKRFLPTSTRLCSSSTISQACPCETHASIGINGNASFSVSRESEGEGFPFQATGLDAHGNGERRFEQEGFISMDPNKISLRRERRFKLIVVLSPNIDSKDQGESRFGV
jgi:hypothetical protein